MPLLVPAPIWENYRDTKIITDFCLSHYIKFKSARLNNYTSLFMKHSCFFRVGGWRVSMFSNLFFKCWQTRGELLNSWNGYQKLHINRVKWNWRKIIFGSACVNSTQFNVEHENACSFPCHIGSSIPIVLICNCAKKLFYNFLYKIHHTQKKFKLVSRKAIKISFSFYFFTIPYQRNPMETLYPKKKSCNIFPTRNICW